MTKQSVFIDVICLSCSSVKYSKEDCWHDWLSWVWEAWRCFMHAGGSWEQDRQHSLKSTTQPLLKKMCFLGWVRWFKCWSQPKQVVKKGNYEKKIWIHAFFCGQLHSHWIFLNPVLDFDCDFWHASHVSRLPPILRPPVTPWLADSEL